jgi:hypothetical protein
MLTEVVTAYAEYFGVYWRHGLHRRGEELLMEAPWQQLNANLVSWYLLAVVSSITLAFQPTIQTLCWSVDSSLRCCNVA